MGTSKAVLDPMRRAMAPLKRTVRPRLQAYRSSLRGLARAEAFCLALISLSSFCDPN